MSWAALAVARRQSVRTSLRTASANSADPFSTLFFNQSPSLAWTQTSSEGNGVVTGILNASDGDSSALSYSVTVAPSHGAVVVDSVGRYTYTPDPQYASTGLTDSFQATVSDADSGFHLHGLLSLVNLLTFGLLGPSGHAGTTTVQVIVAPFGPTPTPGPGPTPGPTPGPSPSPTPDPTPTPPPNGIPVAGTSVVGTPDPATGILAGSVSATDPDGDPLTYSAPAVTAKGSVSINATTGAFTFIPTTASRDAAFAAPGYAVAASITLPAGYQLTQMSFSPDGARAYGILLRSQQSTVLPKIAVINTVTNTITKTLDLPAEATGVLAVSPDGARAYAATLSNGIAVIDTGLNSVVSTVALPKNVPCLLKMGPGGTRLYAAYTDSGTARVAVIDTSSNTIVGNIDVMSRASGLRDFAVSTDGSKIGVLGVFQDWDGVALLNTATNSASGPVFADPGSDIRGTGLAFSPDGSRAYVTTMQDGWGFGSTIDSDASLKVINVASWFGRSPTSIPLTPLTAKVWASVPVSNTAARTVTANSVTIIPDGTRAFVVTGYRGRSIVTVFDTTTNATISTITMPTETTGPVAVSPDGTRAFLGTDAGIKVITLSQAAIQAKTDTLTVTVTDGRGGSVTIPVTVPVTPTNRAPVAGTTVIIPEDGRVSGTVTATDTDGDYLIYGAGCGNCASADLSDGSLHFATVNGTVRLDLAGGFLYVPTLQAAHAAAKEGASPSAGIDSFTIVVTDNHGAATTIPVTVAITPVNRVPTVTGLNYWINAAASTFTVRGSLSDADSDTLELKIGDTTLTPNPDGTYGAPLSQLGLGAAGPEGPVTVKINDGYGGLVAGIAIGGTGFD